MNIFEKIVQATVRRMELLPIDFKNPWWDIFWQQRGCIAVILCSLFVLEVFNTLFPILISQVIISRSAVSLCLFIFLYMCLELVAWFVNRPRMIQLTSQTMESFSYNAYRTLLGVDPIFHAHHSSGVSTGKIRRTSDAYLSLTKTLMDDMVPFAITIVATIASLLYYDISLGCIFAVILLTLGCIFMIASVILTKTIETEWYHNQDTSNHVGNESIARIQYIRTSFAADAMRYRLHDAHEHTMKSAAAFFILHVGMRRSLAVVYMLGIGGMAFFLLHLINAGTMDGVTALSLILMILRSSSPLMKLDKYVNEIVSAYRKITDCFTYVRQYGVQSFPVFSNESVADFTTTSCMTDPVTITLDHINVTYEDEEQPLFTDISLSLAVPRSAENKLYGIIGPSGIGKTTFISLLGGQLKPTAGTVLVNGCDIYRINDNQRQHLIALQGQSASGIYGDLRDNIIFGLPEQHDYSDEYLISILESVGLWHLFKSREGLATLIGEGGVALSGGQRQRLNFANLFIRAKTYHPSIILIDEPTSSLDEVSEQTITDMIHQLSQDSLTLVIAHRIKTLERAEKILDFCLVHQYNHFVFYSRTELQQKSEYFSQLVNGDIVWEE